LGRKLGDSVLFYKLGLQIFMAGGYYELMEWLAARGKKVFVDLKFFDVPETVRLAVAQLRGRKAEFATVHGNDRILEAAVRDNTGVKILAVTVLTSLDRGDLDDLGFACDVEQTGPFPRQTRPATRLPRRHFLRPGGPKLREHLGDKFLIVSPGIRPVENKPDDDQKRTVDAAQAFRNGADYIVVGRPSKTPPIQKPSGGNPGHHRRPFSLMFDSWMVGRRSAEPSGVRGQRSEVRGQIESRLDGVSPYLYPEHCIFPSFP